MNSKISQQIYLKRINNGLSRKEFSHLLNLGNYGYDLLTKLENGSEINSRKIKVESILNFKIQNPYKNKKKSFDYTFIDLCCGIGGFSLAFEKNGGQCIFSSEIDKYASKTYARNFGKAPKGDFTKINAKNIPIHDVLIAGFPCQPFSTAGLKKGFEDARGTIFFEIVKLLEKHNTPIVVLENVKNLINIDKGNTFQIILQTLVGELEITPGKRLNYYVDFKILNALDFGCPQNRERIFIICFNKNIFKFEKIIELFKWPKPKNTRKNLAEILEDSSLLDNKYTLSDNMYQGHVNRTKKNIERGQPFAHKIFKNTDSNTGTLSSRYYKDGKEILIDQTYLGKNPRKLTPRECARLQGFPENFIIDAVSMSLIYKQFGNSVAVPVAVAIAKSIRNFLKLYVN